MEEKSEWSACWQKKMENLSYILIESRVKHSGQLTIFFPP